ncbi:MAG: hypothetical protein DRQ88_01260 [Epsilonproteobacteria bacterium]|nr:MAG: hypothetical protein DRQ89_05330 [Campylobacterota bacterium]RLA67922.1 MAG: hypothetical protein DRQ88_01260 [Campylobacterota bacterium]
MKSVLILSISFIGIWGVNYLYAFYSNKVAIVSYLALITILGILYFFLLKTKERLNWKITASFLFLFTLLTPILMETDQLRYVWDGLISAQGINPYKYAPKELPFFKEIIWAQNINYAVLPSVYPPVAQLLFQISSYLNPYFWYGYLGWEWAPELYITQIWQVTLGLKFLVALSIVFSIYLLKKRRVELLVFHPLFLILGAGNAHIDILLIPIFAIMFFKPQETRKNITAALGTLIKIIPLILYPALLLKWAKKWGLVRSFSNLAVFVSILVFFIFIYARGSDGNLFKSLMIYGEHWYFFGFLNRWLSDLFSFQVAKYICVVLGGIWGLFILNLQRKNEISTLMSALLIFQGLLALMPTLHPWYLLSLLILGLPYMGVLITPWLWPILAMFSKAYYIDESDPVILRNLIYLIVSFFLVRDFRKIRAQKLLNRPYRF